jgi:hypothetical protein
MFEGVHPLLPEIIIPLSLRVTPLRGLARSDWPKGL